MAEEMEMRRELRRRKILENSEKRLRKIASLDNAGDDNEINQKYDSKRVSFSTESDFLEHSFLKRDPVTTIPRANQDITHLFQNPNPDSVTEFETESIEEEKSARLRDWLIVILALLIRYLFLLSEQLSHMFNYSSMTYLLSKIFVPFFAFEIVEFIYFRPMYQENKFIGIVLMLLSRNVGNINVYIKWLPYLTAVFRDTMLYFFSFVLFDIVINMILQQS